jgi:hypothetical protein
VVTLDKKFVVCPPTGGITRKNTQAKLRAGLKKGIKAMV